MLQLTLHTQPPCTVLSTCIRDGYAALRARADARFREGCLSITLTDLGASKRARHRALFECVSTAGSSIRVITEAPDMHGALRSGFAVLQSSHAPCAAAVAERPAWEHA
jgi:hypothetical protein